MKKGASPNLSHVKKTGWKVIRVWEHELKFPEKVAAKLKKVLNQVR
jgi:G:T-mismatch repair DNA endonuclease (very short patch repair protein)